MVCVKNKNARNWLGRRRPGLLKAIIYHAELVTNEFESPALNIKISCLTPDDFGSLFFGHCMYFKV